MDLDHIVAFVAVARHGGFARTSSALHLSQPAISRRIALLERELAAALFERVPRGAALTDAGRALLPHAEAVLASVRDGADAVAAVRGTGAGTVTLALVGTLASTALTERLRDFREAHPGVDLRLQTAVSGEVSALVLRGDAVLGLRYGHDDHPGLAGTTIHHERLLPICAADHRLAGARRIAPEALVDERWIGFPKRSTTPNEPYTSAIEQRLAACGLGDADTVPIDSLTSQKRLVEAGFGIALVPESSVHDELRAGTLRALSIPAMRATVPVVLIHRRRGFQSGATRALIATLAPVPCDARS